MGSYSEVAIRCEKNAYEMFKTVFSKKEYHLKPSSIRHHDELDEYIIHWDFIKWYGWFDGVSMIEKIMSELDPAAFSAKGKLRFYMVKNHMTWLFVSLFKVKNLLHF